MRLPLLLLGLLLVAGATDRARAADAAIVAVTYLEVAPAGVPHCLALLRRRAAASRAEDGNQGVVALQERARTNRLAIIAGWRDAAALAADETAAATFRDALAPLLLAPLDMRVHGALSLGTPASPPPRGALWVVTHVDVVPARKDEAAALLRRLGEASRRERGARRFDILQQASRPNHFTVIEAWTDGKAQAAHAGTAETRQFRAALGPMEGALYDERLYRALE